MAATALAEKSAPTLAAVPTKVRYQGQVMPEGHSRQRHKFKAGAGHTKDDVRHPDYLGIKAKQFTRDDLVTVVADDGSWELEMCVERVTLDSVFCSVRKSYERESLNTAGRIIDGVGDFRSEFRAGMGWCVIRNKDDIAVIRGHANEGNAIAEWRKGQPRPVVG